MSRYAWIFGVVTCAAFSTGCIERRYVIYTDPPGAVVMRNGKTLPGATPVDDEFVYHGNYDFTIFAEGYETLQVHQEIPSRWYEYFPLDFFSENLIPWKIIDRREFHYKLEPRHNVNTDKLRAGAENLRNRGLSIGPPQKAAPPAPAQAAGMPPAQTTILPPNP